MGRGLRFRRPMLYPIELGTNHADVYVCPRVGYFVTPPGDQEYVGKSSVRHFRWRWW